MKEKIKANPQAEIIVLMIEGRIKGIEEYLDLEEDFATIEQAHHQLEAYDELLEAIKQQFEL